MSENFYHQEKKTLLIESFHRCAVRDGLKKATNRAVAKEAGVPLGLLHYYFEGREEMIEALVQWVADYNIERYKMAIKDLNSSEAVFKKAFEFLFVTMMDDSDGSLFYDLWSEAKRNPRIRKSFSYMYDAYRQQIVSQLCDMGLAYGIDENDLKNLSTMLIAMNEGALLQWDMDSESINPLDIARISSEIIISFLNSRKPEQSACQ